MTRQRDHYAVTRPRELIFDIEFQKNAWSPTFYCTAECCGLSSGFTTALVTQQYGRYCRLITTATITPNLTVIYLSKACSNCSRSYCTDRYRSRRWLERWCLSEYWSCLSWRCCWAQVDWRQIAAHWSWWKHSVRLPPLSRPLGLRSSIALLPGSSHLLRCWHHRQRLRWPCCEHPADLQHSPATPFHCHHIFAD